MFVFFENFVIDDRNGNLVNGLTGLKGRYNFPEISSKLIILNFYLEAKGSLSVFEIGLGRGRAVKSLVINEASAAELGSRANNGENSVSASFHNL